MEAILASLYFPFLLPTSSGHSLRMRMRSAALPSRISCPGGLPLALCGLLTPSVPLWTAMHLLNTTRGAGSSVEASRMVVTHKGCFPITRDSPIWKSFGQAEMAQAARLPWNAAVVQAKSNEGSSTGDMVCKTLRKASQAKETQPGGRAPTLGGTGVETQRFCQDRKAYLQCHVSEAAQRRQTKRTTEKEPDKEKPNWSETDQNQDKILWKAYRVSICTL